MARIRTIKPQFYGSASMARVSIEARYLATGLISMADDDGRFLASITAISGHVFPHDDLAPAKVKKLLGELVDEGYVELYEAGGLRYGWLPRFAPNQRINKPQPSALPAPAEPTATKGGKG